MKIVMMQTTEGASDGIVIRGYSKGKIFEVGTDISNRLADSFLSRNLAEIYKEEKSVSAAPINKDAGAATVNKKPETKIETKPDFVMRVFQLADKIEVSSADIISVAKDLGFGNLVIQSGLTQENVDQLRDALGKKARGRKKQS